MTVNDCHLPAHAQARGHGHSHPDGLTSQKKETHVLRQEELGEGQEDGRGWRGKAERGARLPCQQRRGEPGSGLQPLTRPDRKKG